MLLKEMFVYTLKELQLIHFYRQRDNRTYTILQKGDDNFSSRAAPCREQISRETSQQQFVHHIGEQQEQLHCRVQGAGSQG